ncbi:NAD(P)H-dependent oxidoreductase [Streptomyces pimonensis]|uniref:NAD(P)H-dependent oxidoreductase n=1 Tax=Streptomyces pimonensis TaxID=2860288 RepID=A0ABV4J9N1_9ACTN
MDTPLRDAVRLAAVVASVRDGRFAPRIVDWFTRQIDAHGGFALDLVDLRDEELSLVMPAVGSQPDAGTRRVLKTLSPRLADAEAFIVITPEYNRSFPAALKNVIDWHSAEWRAKPVAFVSYGGVSGGLRAVEQLRLVFAELHAVTIRDSVSFSHPWDLIPDDGGLEETEASALAAKTLLDHLAWWAEALNGARTARPYPTAG